MSHGAVSVNHVMLVALGSIFLQANRASKENEEKAYFLISDLAPLSFGLFVLE